MHKILLLLLFVLPFQLHAQQDDAPVTGVSDRRVDMYGFKNARVIVDYQTTLDKADILVADGRIAAIGTNLDFPKGTIVYDLSGKTVYPSFVDIYAGNYGIKTSSSGPAVNPYAAFMTTGRFSSREARPEPRVADYWNDGIHASYDVSTEFIPDTKKADEYRKAGFGTVLTFKDDGIELG